MEFESDCPLLNVEMDQSSMNSFHFSNLEMEGLTYPANMPDGRAMSEIE